MGNGEWDMGVWRRQAIFCCPSLCGFAPLQGHITPNTGELLKTQRRKGAEIQRCTEKTSKVLCPPYTKSTIAICAPSCYHKGNIFQNIHPHLQSIIWSPSSSIVAMPTHFPCFSPMRQMNTSANLDGCLSEVLLCISIFVTQPDPFAGDCSPCG
jgi:hypothetical protein